MKRSLFVIIGSVIVLILILVWIYMLLFNNPNKAGDSFTNLNLGDTTDTTYVPQEGTSASTSDPLVDVTGPERLRQLTTRPVVGYQDIKGNASSTPAVYYVESGTGHIFSIDLTSGKEKRVSGTTIPASRQAAITPNGKFVMMQSGSGSSAEFVVGEIDQTQEKISVNLLEEHIVAFVPTTKNTFMYAVQTVDSVQAKEYNPVTGTTKNLFITPFREAVIWWGKHADDTHYFYPKATYQLEGYVYRVIKGKIERLPVDGYGLSVAGNSTGLLYSKQVDGEYHSFLYDALSQSNLSSLLTIIPEKCIGLVAASSSLICGGSLNISGSSLPDLWYQGSVSYADDIWMINTTNGVAQMLASVSDMTGRQIDIAEMIISNDDQRLYFINSTDNYLWSFTPSFAETALNQ